MRLDSSIDAADVASILDRFGRLSMLCRAWNVAIDDVRAEISRGTLPKPSYVLGNDLEFVPDDYFVFPAQADPEQRRQLFSERYLKERASGGFPCGPDDAKDAWREYISGGTATYLRVLLPETIARKACLVRRVEALLQPPDSHSSTWRKELALQVDALDSLLRPVIPCDRARTKHGALRDVYVTRVRQTVLVPSVQSASGTKDFSDFGSYADPLCSLH